MRRERWAGRIGFWTLLVMMLWALPFGRARGESGDGEEAWRQFHGQLLFSDVLFAPAAEFPSVAARIASLRRSERTVVDGPNGFWRIHCIAFLDPVPTTGALVLRTADVTDPTQPREIRVFEISTKPGTRELPIDDFVLTDAIGFERGHRYEMTVERGGEEPVVSPAPPATGKRDVYAKGVVTLR